MADQSRTIPELPTLEPGMTLLETGTDGVPLQTLAVDHLLVAGGNALWVGTGQHCRTDSFAEIAPDRRVLDRIDVARGFTAYQHTALVDALGARVDDGTAVVVLPDIDARYRDDVQGGDGREMLVRALATLAGVAREHEIPVLYTRSRADEFSAPAETAASRTIAFRETPMGPRFVGDTFETLVYPVAGEWVQTTLAFWQEVLRARRPIHGETAVHGEVDGEATTKSEVIASGSH